MDYASFKDEIDLDELFEEAARFVIDSQKASASLLQRQLSIGYARAARILDQLEMAEIVSKGDGAMPRDVLISSYDDYLASSGKHPVTVRAVAKVEEIPEWTPVDLSKTPFSSFQKKFKDGQKVHLPVGFSQGGKVITYPISDLGGIFIFTNKICRSLTLLDTILDVMASTYSPDLVKFLVYDEAGQISDVHLKPGLVTPVIKSYDKWENTLGWALHELNCRNKLFREVGAKNIEEYNKLGHVTMPRMIIAINDPSETMIFSDPIPNALQRIISSGNQAGIHPIILAPMNDKKFAKILTTVPSKIVFKTFSVPQADLLGTDDAFDLSNPNEFIFIPPYGKVEKLFIRV